jgi:hypothetical protein
MLGVYNEAYAALKAPLFHGTASARLHALVEVSATVKEAK